MSAPTEDLVARTTAVCRGSGGERFATDLAAPFAPEPWATAFTGRDRW